MDRLSKKEIILLSVMAVVVLYGTYDLFLSAPSKIPESIGGDKSQLNAFVSDISTNIAKETPTLVDKYSIARAEAGWKRDPFSGSSVSMEGPDTVKRSKAAKGTAFAFTGYLEAGNRKIAVINGVEYAVGELLDSSGNYLESIYASSVVIENRAKGLKFEVKLKE